MAFTTSAADGLKTNVLIAGAGIIGLSLALELRRSGAAVTVLDHGMALGGASTAAAGMLAARDPHNPAALLSLARHSLTLYPAFLARIEGLGGLAVSFQTSATVQYATQGSYRLAEHSIDPRQLGPALLAAARASGVLVFEQMRTARLISSEGSLSLETADGSHFSGDQLVHTTGAWLPFSSPHINLPVTPRKGQMLRVALPKGALLNEVHRAEHVYVVPRTAGPQAGSALIGATVENAGFDLSTNHQDLEALRAAAAALAPETAFAAQAPLVECWAGLRPSTPDLLPVIGQLRNREWIATGHFRNGILLAPGTAQIMAELLAGRQSPINLAAFAANRFARADSA